MTQKASPTSTPVPLTQAVLVEEIRCLVAGRTANSSLPLVVALDGRSGAGKTTLASYLGEKLAEAGLAVKVFHMENLYQGWEGLEAGISQWSKNAHALKDSRTLVYFGWDWAESKPTGPHVLGLKPHTLLICEGVGSALGQADLKIWVELEAQERKQRALARDGETYRPFWDTWAAQEEAIAPLYQKITFDFVYEPQL